MGASVPSSSRRSDVRSRCGERCISGKCFPFRQKKPSECAFSLSPRAESGAPSSESSTTMGHCAVQIRQSDFAVVPIRSGLAGEDTLGVVG